MKTEIRYGLYGALAIIAWELGEFALGFHGEKLALSKMSGALFTIVPAIILFLGLKARREELNGYLTLRQGIKSGFLISLIFAGIASVFMYFYVTTIHPEFLPKKLEYNREMAFDQYLKQAPERSENQARRLAKEMYPDSDTDIVQVTLSYWVLRLCSGLLIGLVMTAILRKEPMRFWPIENPSPPGDEAAQHE